MGLTAEPQELAGVEPLQELCVEAATLDGQMVQRALLIALAQDVLLDCVLGDQSIDVYLPRLPDAVTPILSLPISAEATFAPCCTAHITSLGETSIIGFLPHGDERIL